MPFRIKSKKGYRARAASTLNGFTGAFSGTFAPAVNRTGIAASTLSNITGAISGVFTSAPNRTGSIAVTLAPLQPSMAGTFTTPASRSGTLPALLQPFTSAILGTSSAGGVDVVPGTIYANGATSLARLRMTRGGDQQATDILGTTFSNMAPQAWISPKAGNAGVGYQVRLTVDSGTPPTGAAVGIWLSLGTTRTWDLSSNTAGFTFNTCTLAVSNNNGSTILDSATIQMIVEVEF